MNPEQLEIINRVKEMYFRYGIKSVTMDDVARELSISKKTLYQHFSDKEQLVDAVVDQLLIEKIDIVDGLISGCSDAISEMFAIHQFMDKMSRDHSYAMENDLRKYYPALFNKIMSVKRERIFRIGKENIERGQQTGYYRPEVNAEMIAKTSLMRFESSMESCIFTCEELLSQDFFTEMLIYHVRGIATAKGIKRLEEILAELEIK
ncbi:MAG: TetR/AcrR family transcriptional regulator [Bacteroidales bacterium]|nr:TetR/AcrR family transcriptional regulator [Bacteroidales bacterium]